MKIIGLGISSMHRTDQSIEDMIYQVCIEATKDAGIELDEIGHIFVSNMMNGSLSDQESIRGQTFLRGLKFGDTSIFNCESGCASGGAAFALGVMASKLDERAVLVLGFEKMCGFDSKLVRDTISQGLPFDQRNQLRLELDKTDTNASITMQINALWAKRQMEEKGLTLDQFAATAAKARRCAARTDYARHRELVTIDQVLASRIVSEPLTRLMCSSYTDGAVAIIISSSKKYEGPEVIGSKVVGGFGDQEAHTHLAAAANSFWEETSVSPNEIDLAEIHDATSPEELWNIEALGLVREGSAGHLTMTGETDLGGNAVYVNPSGGLVGRGHPIGATGLAQIAEISLHLSGKAIGRQRERSRVALASNLGGLINEDVATFVFHLLKA